MPNRLRALRAAVALLESTLMGQNEALCMKNTEKAAMPMSPML
jgi:hypothetical protein